MTAELFHILLGALALLITLNSISVAYLIKTERRLTRIETTCKIKTTGCFEPAIERS